MNISTLRHIAHKNLCLYDRRSYYYEKPPEDDEDPRVPRNGCMCDKCFYGKDEIAVAILEFLDQ